MYPLCNGDKKLIRSAINLPNQFIIEVREWLKDTSHALFLYGAGSHLPWVLYFLRYHNLKISAILDSSRTGEYAGIPIINFDSFLDSLNDGISGYWFVISAPSVEEQITNRLRAEFSKAIITCCEMQLYPNFIPDVDNYRSYLIENWDEFVSFSFDLEDERSKETLRDVLLGRVTGDLNYFKSCYSENQYYPSDIVHFSDEEVMVELGSYDGDTLSDFIRQCPSYTVVYCFEPNKKLTPKLKLIQQEQASRGRRIVVVEKGAWDREDRLLFQSNDISDDSWSVTGKSRECDSAGVDVTSVDLTVVENITFLKMDVEGAELHALHGAETQIRNNKPKLAVCVYHKPEDILDIWRYLKKLVPEYSFYLRHHNKYAGTETVLYAVIK